MKVILKISETFLGSVSTITHSTLSIAIASVGIIISCSNALLTSRALSIMNE